METLNAEQVKKALMYCTEYAPLRCDECPMEAPNMTFKGSLSCSDELMRKALTLITSQEQRIKELAEDLHATRTELTRVQEENERLRSRYIDGIVAEGKRTNEIPLAKVLKGE